MVIAWELGLISMETGLLVGQLPASSHPGTNYHLTARASSSEGQQVKGFGGYAPLIPHLGKERKGEQSNPPYYQIFSSRFFKLIYRYKGDCRDYFCDLSQVAGNLVLLELLDFSETWM